MNRSPRRDDGEGQLTWHSPAEAIRQFEAALSGGMWPNVPDFLGPTTGRARAELAAELIRRDLGLRIRTGHESRVDHYLPDVPELRDSDVELVALLLDEHSLRSEVGQTVELDEYLRRFPQHVDTLRVELGLTDGYCQSPRQECRNSDISNAEHLSEGMVVGDFRIERLLGAGGVSRVYLATQLSLDRRIALKVTAESDDDQRPLDEGRAMAAIVHDHIVAVYSELKVDGQLLLAMEYVDGPTLSDFIQANRTEQWSSTKPRLPFDLQAHISRLCDSPAEEVPQDCPHRPTRRISYRDFVCETIRDIACALDFAARKGVQHSDVKPANILLSKEGRALLADFNVAIRLSPSGDVSAVGGTLQYMAPEQLAILTGTDTANATDGRSDIYALGLVFFELLTASWPFPEGDVSTDPVTASVQLQASRLSSKITFPASSRLLTPALKSILSKCLASKPTERYQTAGALAEDIDHFLTHRTLKYAADRNPVERTARLFRRFPITAPLLAAVPLLLAVVFFSEPAHSDAFYSRRELREAITGGNIASLEATRQALDFDRQAQDLIRNAQFAQATRLLEASTALNPQIAPVWHNLAVARFRLGQFAESLDAFDRSIALGNESALAHAHRAAARFAAGDVEGARDDFSTARKRATASELPEVEVNWKQFIELTGSSNAE